MSIPIKSNWTGKIYLWDKIICNTPCQQIEEYYIDFRNNSLAWIESDWRSFTANRAYTWFNSTWMYNTTSWRDVYIERNFDMNFSEAKKITMIYNFNRNTSSWWWWWSFQFQDSNWNQTFRIWSNWTTTSWYIDPWSWNRWSVGQNHSWQSAGTFELITEADLVNKTAKTSLTWKTDITWSISDSDIQTIKSATKAKIWLCRVVAYYIIDFRIIVES